MGYSAEKRKKLLYFQKQKQKSYFQQNVDDLAKFL